MAALKNEVKAFIVQGLACYDTPSEVASAVKEEFDLIVSKQQCELYDPTKYAGRDLSKRWRVLFDDTRARFRVEVAEIPIATRAFRLRQLSKNLAIAGKSRNLLMSNQVLEQAAKEVGDAYVNRRGAQDRSLDDEIKLLEIEKRKAELKLLEKGGGNANAQLLADLIAKLPS